MHFGRFDRLFNQLLSEKLLSSQRLSQRIAHRSIRGACRPAATSTACWAHQKVIRRSVFWFLYHEALSNGFIFSFVRTCLCLFGCSLLIDFFGHATEVRSIILFIALYRPQHIHSTIIAIRDAIKATFIVKYLSINSSSSKS